MVPTVHSIPGYIFIISILLFYTPAILLISHRLVGFASSFTFLRDFVYSASRIAEAVSKQSRTSLEENQTKLLTRVYKWSFFRGAAGRKAAMRQEIIGGFTIATSAEDSYRCAFDGGENDTFRLKQTVKHRGSK